MKAHKQNRRITKYHLISKKQTKTIPNHHLEAWLSSFKIKSLKPAAEGTGIIAGGPVRAVMECAGIKDIRAKCLRSNNPANVVAATFAGLKSLRGPEEIAKIRGKSVEEIVG